MASHETLLTPRSSRVKAAHTLTRRASRLSERKFLAEGPQAVREAMELAGCVDEVFATPDATRRHSELKARAASLEIPWRSVDDAALARLAATVSPQGVVAVCKFLDAPLDVIMEPGVHLIAICACVRDPGNAGSIIRLADAVGADAVVLAGKSVDPYNGKCVRASAGSLFHLPIVTGVSVAEAVSAVRAAGASVLAADGAGTVCLDDARASELLTGPTAWLFGNEAWGLPAEDAARADQVVRVPIYGRAESLNLATAAAICLYASARAQHSYRGSLQPRQETGSPPQVGAS